MDKVPKKKTASVNFTCALFSLLDFLTLVLKHRWGVSTQGCIYLRRVQISQDKLVKQALVWLCVVWFRAILLGTSYASLIQP